MEISVLGSGSAKLGTKYSSAFAAKTKIQSQYILPPGCQVIGTPQSIKDQS
jgi:hypothetical protein